MLGTEERDRLLSRMRELIERWGWQTYVAAPVLEPDDRYFPDPYTPDLAGLRTVARRLLAYAGLGHLEVDASGVERADHDPLAQTHVRLLGLDERELSLGVYALGAAEEVPLVLAHEVARAVRQLRAGPMRAVHPYRTPAVTDDEDEVPDEEEEEEVSLTACYLGMGLLVAIGAHRYKAAGELSGTVVITRWVHLCLGALAPDEACFLLAAQAVARAVNGDTVGRWRAALGANEQQSFTRFVAELRDEREALLEKLALPPEARWPPAWDGVVEPFEDDGWAPEIPDEELPAHPVFRRPEHRGWTLAVLGGVAALAALIAVPIVAPPIFVWAVLVGGPALCLGLYFAGKRLRRPDTCSICETKLADQIETCPGCEGTIRGTLGEGESHLAALERAGVVTTHEGLLAEEQPDADPRYLERGVKCPTCAWIPDGGAHWSCEACLGEPFNTFEHGGECPACGEVFEATLCPRCEHLAPYDWWWPRD